MAETEKREDLCVQVFTRIYRSNAWGGRESVSGHGSDLAHTAKLVGELPPLFRSLGIASILDIPCGDFNWMQTVPMDGIDYLGADIVEELVHKVQMRHAGNRLRFQRLDVRLDDLPKVDLILCRDCLVHLSTNDVFLALRNVCRSQSRYLLTTTFPWRQENPDIATGRWRPINFEAAPFRLPQPLHILNEKHGGRKVKFGDKSLGLWSIGDIAAVLGKHIESSN
jgi:hypothetical protein